MINISLFFIKLDNKTEIDNEKIITKNIKTATDYPILLIANEMNYSLVVVFSFFLFFYGYIIKIIKMK